MYAHGHVEDILEAESTCGGIVINRGIRGAVRSRGIGGRSRHVENEGVLIHEGVRLESVAPVLGR